MFDVPGPGDEGDMIMLVNRIEMLLKVESTELRLLNCAETGVGLEELWMLFLPICFQAEVHGCWERLRKVPRPIVFKQHKSFTVHA